MEYLLTLSTRAISLSFCFQPNFTVRSDVKHTTPMVVSFHDQTVLVHKSCDYEQIIFSLACLSWLKPNETVSSCINETEELGVVSFIL
jgi:hypothetical protein